METLKSPLPNVEETETIKSHYTGVTTKPNRGGDLENRGDDISPRRKGFPPTLDQLSLAVMDT